MANTTFQSLHSAFQITEVDRHQWRHQRRQSFKPLNAGEFLLVPAWQETPIATTTLRIFPDTAFGSGEHATTRMMLAAMTKDAFGNRTVLDVGCGTGILSLAAGRLGAKSVFGFDADPDCRENMHHHLALNPTANVQLRIGYLADFSPSPVDWVLANVTLNVWREIITVLPPWLKEKGQILGSGLLASQLEDMDGLLAGIGYRRIDTWTDQSWQCFRAECV